jgi:drug/metabolite transporter (DMT)-like permease
LAFLQSRENKIMTKEAAPINTILSANLSMAAYVVGDICVKLVGQTYPPGEIIFWRTALGALIIGALLAKRGPVFSLRMLSPRVLARSVFDCINIFSFVTAITHLNLAECYAILLTAPLLMTVLAVVFFREPVGWRRWLAIIIGFGGALLIIRPDTHAFNWWAAVAALCALAAASREIITARIARDASVLEMTLTTFLITGAVALLLSIWEIWSIPTPRDAGLLSLMTAGWMSGTLLLIYACRIGPISAVAFSRYTLLIWGAIGGYLVFAEYPDIWTFAGAAIIVGSGFYVFRRETIRNQPLALKPDQLVD